MPQLYTVHFGADVNPEWDTETFSFTRQGILINGELQPPVGVGVIRDLKSTLDQLLSSTASYDRVATFALGGVFPIDYMMIEIARTGQSIPEDRFHLFAGLNWRPMPFDPKVEFTAWIDSLPSGSSVLLFDTGRVGNAGGQLRNLLVKHYREDYLGVAQADLSINISVIVTNPEATDKPQTTFTSKDGKQLNLSLQFLKVQGTPFEDAFYFIGADRLQANGMMVRKMTLGGITVDFGTHQNIVVGAASAGFMTLFSEARLRLLEAINNPALEEIVLSPDFKYPET